jgi:hypothetical protein
MANTFKNARLVAGTAATDVYTAGSGVTAIVIQAQVANVGTADEEVSVWWTDASAADAITRLVNDVVIPPKVAVGAIEGKLVLEAGDKLRIEGQTANNAEISVSVLEIS